VNNKNDRVTHEKTHLMYSLIRIKMLASCVLLSLAFLPRAQAVVPAPDGGYPNLNTAEGDFALLSLTSGAANAAIGFGSLALDTTGQANTAVGALSLLLNTTGQRNTANGAGALFANGTGEFNGAFGTAALSANVDGFSNNAFGDSALSSNVTAADNTAVGDLALEFNDSSGLGLGNNNVAVGAGALVSSDGTTGNIDGSENTAVGTGAGPNLVSGFNNTYVGDFVGTDADDEDSTIRIGDLSNGNGAGSEECYIGGIWNNAQPVGPNVVVVTLNLLDDHLGYDPGVAGGAAAKRSAPQPRVRPQPAHQAMLNNKVEKLQATVAQQQKQIETLTAQLREQAAQIQKVSAQLEMVRPTPRVVENR
jgi:uncharacterized coiled-coil protein SlyX